MPHSIKISNGKESKWPSRPEMNVDTSGIPKSQELTEDEKKQARENIRAFPAPKSLRGVADVGHPINGGEYNTMYMMDGIFTKPTDPNKAQIAGLYLVSMTDNVITPGSLNDYRKMIESMYKAGFFTWTFKFIMVSARSHISRVHFNYNEQKKTSTLLIEYFNYGIYTCVTENLEDNTLQYEYSGPMNIEVETTSRGNVYFCNSLARNLTLTEAKNLYSAMRGSLVFNGEPFIAAELTENSITIVHMGKGEDGEYGVQKTTVDNITWKAETT